MATQGLLSVTLDGEVIAKVVCGCDGYNIPVLEKLVKELSAEECDEVTLYHLAKDSAKLGCEGCLVTITKTGHMCSPDLDELGDLYESTFSDPNFNPRWDAGTAPYVAVVPVAQKAKDRTETPAQIGGEGEK